jgi:hypothetical protein
MLQRESCDPITAPCPVPKRSAAFDAIWHYIVYYLFLESGLCWSVAALDQVFEPRAPRFILPASARGQGYGVRLLLSIGAACPARMRIASTAKI